MGSRARFSWSILVVVVIASLSTAVHLQANGTLYLVDGTNLYTVDVGTAALAVVGPAFDDGLAPSDNPSSYLFIASQEPALYALPRNGTAQVLIAPIGGDGDRGLAYNMKTGMLFGTDNQSFGSIDTVTGAFTALASPPTETECLAADPGRNLVYGLDTDIEDLMAYDVAGDTWSVIGPTSVANGGKAGMAYDPEGDVIYVADREDTGNLYSVNPVTGATTHIGVTGADSSFYGLTFVPDQIFADGFESGDVSAWSVSVP